MSIILADGFDHYGVGAGSNQNMLDGAYAQASGNITADQHRTGLYSYRIDGASVMRRNYGGAFKVMGIAIAQFFSTLPGNNLSTRLMQFSDSANRPQVTILVESTGTLACWLGDNGFENGTLIARTTAQITAAAWNHFEVKIDFDLTDGAIEIRLNEVTILNLTGIRTVSTNVTGPEETSSQFQVVSSSSSAVHYLDDLIVWNTDGTVNNDFLGDRKVFTRFPDADGAEVDWTPLSGSTRWQMVDDPAPDGDTTYDYTADAGDKMNVTFPDVDPAVVAIAGIVLIQKVRKTDAGTCTLQASLQSGGDAAAGVDRAITTQYTLYHDVFDVDPHTAAPFTPAAASAIAMSLERTS